MSAADATRHRVERAVIALGSNQAEGEHSPETTLRAAVRELALVDGVELVRSSLVYSSPALTLAGIDRAKPAYVNAVVLVDTTLTPHELLAACHRIEQRHGRVRDERWGDRTLDLDLIAFGERQIDDGELTVPHPRAHERGFVVRPWLEVDPVASLPGIGALGLLRAADDESVVPVSHVPAGAGEAHEAREPRAGAPESGAPRRGSTDSRPQPPREPTSPGRSLLLFALLALGAAVGYVAELGLASRGYAVFTPIWPLAALGVVVAAIVLALAWPVRQSMRRDASGRPLGRAVDPFAAVRVLGLARAVIYASAVFAGVLIGVLIWFASRFTSDPGSLIVTGATLVSVAVLFGAGLVAESWCAVPPADRDDAGDGRRALDGAPRLTRTPRGQTAFTREDAHAPRC